MADEVEGADARVTPAKDWNERSAGEKRRSTEDVSREVSSPKKFSMPLGGTKPAVSSQKISISLGGNVSGDSKKISSVNIKPKAPIAPIKMSLGAPQKSKEPSPVVQKSAQAASVFNESDESDDEEMPPEAKMRMKNIGRETPTASGPNSYGKGKHGFTDRHKIIEKQLKEDMDKVSGDNSNRSRADS